MAGISPRLWQLTPKTSPRQFPSGPVLFTSSEVLELSMPKMPENDSINLDELRQFVGAHTLPNGDKISDLLDLSKYRPLLVAGELANPYRLADIMAPTMPLIPVRIENICRTWADSLDAREVQPGVHHVTIIRSPGWWESTFIALLEPAEMKRIVQWLDAGVQNTWSPKRLAEGIIRLESDLSIQSQNLNELEWDGVSENVSIEIPPANGPALDLNSLIVPIHTRMGCYNSRGRVARCSHYSQDDFHKNLFRRGSSFKWSDLLTTL